MTRFWILLLAFGAWAQSSGPAFEVASVKASSSDATTATVTSVDDAGIRLRLPLQRVVCMAYEVRTEQVSGPSWLAKVSFDIEAKLPAGATRDQIPAMLQNLLAERFRMSVHRQLQERPVYALVIAKGGLKMQPKPIDASTPASPSCADSLYGKARQTVTAGDLRNVLSAEGGRVQMQRISTLVSFISTSADRPVIDKTNLKNGYDIKLDLPFTQGNSSDPRGTIDPVIVNALDKLGLRLEPQRAPIEMIVVDRIQPNPTED